jgi:pimeloyl-ACP methyl ester carboxylesterase
MEWVRVGSVAAVAPRAVEGDGPKSEYCYRPLIGNRRAEAAIDHVIYVHGLFMTGADGLFLRRRIERDFGMKTHTFRYRSVSGSMSDIAERLVELARGLRAERVHFIGHSLGGLVIYRALERNPDLPPGRVVFLGVPSVASRAAVGWHDRLAWASKLMGSCVTEELLSPHTRRWHCPHELGVIAGTRPFGLGRFAARFEEDNDGTVCVPETRMPGAADLLTLPVSHMGMLMSAKVARETAAFLRDGRFTLGN